MTQETTDKVLKANALLSKAAQLLTQAKAEESEGKDDLSKINAMNISIGISRIMDAKDDISEIVENA